MAHEELYGMKEQNSISGRYALKLESLSFILVGVEDSIIIFVDRVRVIPY